MEEFKLEPPDYRTLFDFLRYKKTKNIIRSVSDEYAKAMRGGT
jgi:hypothetical protein